MCIFTALWDVFTWPGQLQELLGGLMACHQKSPKISKIFKIQQEKSISLANNVQPQMDSQKGAGIDCLLQQQRDSEGIWVDCKIKKKTTFQDISTHWGLITMQNSAIKSKKQKKGEQYFKKLTDHNNWTGATQRIKKWLAILGHWPLHTENTAKKEF